MDEKKRSDVVAGKEYPDSEDPPVRTEGEFKEFEELISSVNNVEYEDNTPSRPKGLEDFLEQRSRAETEGFTVSTSENMDRARLSIPLKIELPDGTAGKYYLHLTLSLEQQKDAEDHSGSGPPGVGTPSEDEPSEFDIDILDGRTSLIFGEDEDHDETPKEFLEEEDKRGLIARMFSVWKKKKKD